MIIGKVIQDVYRQKNYVGKEVDEYFCHPGWSEYMTLIIRPESAKYDKQLGSVSPRSVLERKVTMEDLLDSIGDEEDNHINKDVPPALSYNPSETEDVSEHMITIDSHYIDSKVFDATIQHDLDDIMRGEGSRDTRDKH